MSNWDYDTFVGQVDLSEHTGLLLAEDAALKAYLSGITVPDKGGMTEAAVYFRYPEGERRIKYPFITIDFLNIAPSYDRWTSLYTMKTEGLYVPSTSPSLPEGTEGTGVVVEPFLMHTLTYQVAVHARSALHDRYLMSRFMTDIFPPRSFFIGVDADDTWRRSELLGMQPADYTETSESGNKRVFRKIYTISMDAEVPQNRIREVEKVLRVHIDTYQDSQGVTRESTSHSSSGPHTFAEPVTVEPPPGP